MLSWHITFFFNKDIAVSLLMKSAYTNYMSHVMRKPAFCICEKKGADQLCGSPTADLISAFLFAT